MSKKKKARKALAKTKSLGITGPTSSERDLIDLIAGGISNISKKSVTPETAPRVPAVLNALIQISEATALCSFSVFEYGQDGARRRAIEHPAHRLINRRASKFQSAGRFRAQLVVNSLLYGFGLGHVVQAGGRPHELINLKPNTISISEDPNSGDLVFTQNTKNGPRVLDRNALVFLPSLSVDGVRFEAPIKRCRESIARLMVLEECILRFFARGSNPGGILSPKVPMSTSALELAIKVFKEQVAGSENFGEDILMPAQFEWHRRGVTMLDAAIEQIYNAAILDIARAFSIPSFYLQDLSKSTWNNSAAQKEAFRTYTLASWLERLEAAYTEAFIPPQDQNRFYVEANADVLLRGNTLEQAQVDQIRIASRTACPNEIRERDNLSPYEGGSTFLNPNTTSGPIPSNNNEKNDDSQEN